MTNSGTGPGNTGEDWDHETHLMPSGQAEAATPSSTSPTRPTPTQSSVRWYERTGGAVLAGSLVGLGFAVLVAALLVLLVPKDNDAEANADPDPEGTPTETASATATQAGGGETPAPPVQVNFSGTWVTNFARLEMMQDGKSVTGQYFRFLDDNSPRTIEGVITDRTLDGTFDGPNPLRFQLANDGRSFTGHWVDPQGGLHEWCGALDAPLPDGCGYSGEWRVKGLPIPADPPSGTVRMEQDGDSVLVTFESGARTQVEFRAEFDGTTLARASGRAEVSAAVTLDIEFLVTEDPEWRAFTGTWRSATQSGTWCGAMGDVELPC